jgi:hypothetical protein
MLTNNNHGTPTTITDFVIVFGFVVPSAEAPDTATATFPTDQVYAVTQTIDLRYDTAQEGTSQEEWALVRLDRPTHYPPLGIHREPYLPTGTNLLLVGHPSGLPRKYADHATVGANSDPVYFETNLDAYAGNSGPLFSIVLLAKSKVSL